MQQMIVSWSILFIINLNLSLKQYIFHLYILLHTESTPPFNSQKDKYSNATLAVGHTCLHKSLFKKGMKQQKFHERKFYLYLEQISDSLMTFHKR